MHNTNHIVLKHNKNVIAGSQAYRPSVKLPLYSCFSQPEPFIIAKFIIVFWANGKSGHFVFNVIQYWNVLKRAEYRCWTRIYNSFYNWTIRMGDVSKPIDGLPHQQQDGLLAESCRNLYSYNCPSAVLWKTRHSNFSVVFW